LEADAAGDLVQDVFAILVEKLPQFTYNPQRSFRAWLKTVTLNRWREQARRRRTVRLPAGADELADSAADAPTFLEEAEYRDQLVRRVMALIENDFETTTWLACWQYVALDRKPADVAEALGISVNAVYLAKSRVLRRLREELDGLVDWSD
jgi:RNA polymerase sigma-70 factor (ECF subfamily)